MSRTLLLVDDEPAMLTALQRELRGSEFRLLTAGSGAQALDVLTRETIQVIISDYRMPGMTGVELLAEVRRRQPDTVRMVLSGYADFSALVEAINEGHVYKFLGKPWEPADLLSAIRDAFERYDMVQRDRRFAQVFEHTHEGIFILDAERRLAIANRAFATMIGVGTESLASATAADFVRDASGVPFAQMIDEANRSGRWQGDAWLHRDDKSSFPVALTISVVRDGNGGVREYVGLCLDITERMLREAALRESERRFRDFMEFAPIGMAIVALDGQILRANQMLCTILGFERGELEGQHFESLTMPDDLAADLAMRRQLVEGELDIWKAEKQYLHKDGHAVWVQLTASVLRDAAGVPQCFDAQIEDISERRRQQETIHRLAFFDALTGLPNRRLLNDRLEQALAQARRGSRLAALAFLDLDHFKQVNDVHGHDAGDLVLKEAARRLNACVRRGDTVARQGGDEFIVLLHELGAADDIAIVGDKIVSELAQPYALESMNLRIDVITTSIGFALFPTDGVTAGELMKRADLAMYAAKEGGRNGWRRYDEAMAAEPPPG